MDLGARALVALLAAAGAAAILGSAGSASPDARIAKSVRFVDELREDLEAPDITAVTVSNTAVTWTPASVIAFRIEIANRPTLTEDMRVALWIDADDDPATGLSVAGAVLPGADYFVNWDHKLRDGASLLSCRDAKCTTVAARSFRFSYASGARFALRADDLGDTRRFRFAARAYSGIAGSRTEGLDFTGMRLDYAPAEGMSWRYGLRIRIPARP